MPFCKAPGAFVDHFPTRLLSDGLYAFDCSSVKMSRDETERYMNIQVESSYWKGQAGSQLSFLYPAIYTITCRLNIRSVFSPTVPRLVLVVAMAKWQVGHITDMNSVPRPCLAGFSRSFRCVNVASPGAGLK